MVISFVELVWFVKQRLSCYILHVVFGATCKDNVVEGGAQAGYFGFESVDLGCALAVRVTVGLLIKHHFPFSSALRYPPTISENTNAAYPYDP